MGSAVGDICEFYVRPVSGSRRPTRGSRVLVRAYSEGEPDVVESSHLFFSCVVDKSTK